MKENLFAFAIAVLLIATLACAATISQPIAETAQASSTEGQIWTYNQTIDGLVFAGKIVNPNTNAWENNHLVLLFLQSKEIARMVTSTGKYDATLASDRQKRLDGGLGVIDGLFIIRIPNTYELLPNNLGIPIEESQFVVSYDDQIGGWNHPNGLATWLDPLYEGSSRDFFVPSKNIHYTLMVLPGDVAQLPAEIQQPSSVAFLEGNRLVAIDPNSPAPTPQSAFTNNLANFQQVAEDVQEFPPAIFPINNCGGAADVKQEITQTYIHEIIDESKAKLGVEIPIHDWLTIVAEIEQYYGISDKEITTYSSTLTAPAGQNIQYTVIRKQTWETGVAVVTSSGVEISAPYRILKSETFEVANSEQRSCP